MSVRPDGAGAILPSLDAQFSPSDISMNLTMCGLLVEQAEELARLYATHREWTAVESRWFEERHDGRSTRDSSRKVYRILSSRFKTAGQSLPATSRLPTVFDQCETRRDRAQVLYFYLVMDDPLVRFVVHEYVSRLHQQGSDGLDFAQETIETILDDFRYVDGTTLDYAESTIERWGQGFRSVMRDIGVLETQQTTRGQTPNVGTVPLLVAAGYSWEQQGPEWLSTPSGWLSLFQQERHWNSLVERLAAHDHWDVRSLPGDVRLRPLGETYAWADPREGDT